jgi:hypothetical protein
VHNGRERRGNDDDSWFRESFISFIFVRVRSQKKGLIRTSIYPLPDYTSSPEFLRSLTVVRSETHVLAWDVSMGRSLFCIART